MQDRVYIDGGIQYTLQGQVGAARDVIPGRPTKRNVCVVRS